MPIEHNIFWVGIALIGVTFALTLYVFRHRLFEHGSRTYKTGKAASPAEVRRQNPPDPES